MLHVTLSRCSVMGASDWSRGRIACRCMVRYNILKAKYEAVKSRSFTNSYQCILYDQKFIHMKRVKRLPHC